MRYQHRNAQEGISENEDDNKAALVPADPVNEYGFVAVCAGNGLTELFKDIGADIVVSGGQTMNPSTDDILKRH